MELTEIPFNEVMAKLKNLSTNNDGIVILGIDDDSDVLEFANRIHYLLIEAQIFPRFSSLGDMVKEVYFFYLPEGRKDLVFVFNDVSKINTNLLEVWKRSVTGVAYLNEWSPSYDGRPNQ